MTYLQMEIKKLGRSIWNDNHNITSMIRTPQVCPRRFGVGRSLTRWKSINTHTLEQESYLWFISPKASHII